MTNYTSFYSRTNMTRIEKSIKNSGGKNEVRIYIFLTPFVTADWFFGAAELRHRESSKR